MGSCEWDYSRAGSNQQVNDCKRAETARSRVDIQQPDHRTGTQPNLLSANFHATFSMKTPIILRDKLVKYQNGVPYLFLRSPSMFLHCFRNQRTFTFCHFNHCFIRYRRTTKSEHHAPQAWLGGSWAVTRQNTSSREQSNLADWKIIKNLF